MASTSNYIARVQKLTTLFTASRITLDEYAENLLLSCVTYPEVDELTAREVAASIPQTAQVRVQQEIEKILAPSFRFPDLHYDGPGPSPELRENKRCVYEIRIRWCSRALKQAMTTV